MCQVAWATPAQSRATGNRWVIEELTAKEQAARERGAALWDAGCAIDPHDGAALDPTSQGGGQ